MVAKTYCFDLDGTLCTQDGVNYESAEPLTERIEVVNRLYASGNQIIIFTARGSGTGMDHSELTQRQLQNWGVNFHRLILGKPAADVYVDDRATNAEDFLWQ